MQQTTTTDNKGGITIKRKIFMNAYDFFELMPVYRGKLTNIEGVTLEESIEMEEKK